MNDMMSKVRRVMEMHTDPYVKELLTFLLREVEQAEQDRDRAWMIVVNYRNAGEPSESPTPDEILTVLADLRRKADAAIPVARYEKALREINNLPGDRADEGSWIAKVALETTE